MNEEIIVSLTSYPKRLSRIKEVIESIRGQTLIPQKVILYLDSNEFRNKDEARDVLDITDDFFLVKWVDLNLRVHGKYFYALQEYCDKIVITIDDDVLYDSRCIEDLYNKHLEFPDCVVCRRGKLLSWRKDGGISSYNNWYELGWRNENKPRVDLLAMGVGGVLYPPFMSSKGLFDVERIKATAPNADDIWLKAIETNNDVTVVYVKPSGKDLFLHFENAIGLYLSVNKDGGNDRQISKIETIYRGVFSDECRMPDSLIDTEVKQMLEEDQINKIASRKRILDSLDSFIIYGAGKYAHTLLDEISCYGMDKKIEGIAVSDLDKEYCINGVSVKCIEQYVGDKKEHNYILAVRSENYKAEILRRLAELGVPPKNIYDVEY